jgi:anti-sigma B factor antagonist
MPDDVNIADYAVDRDTQVLEVEGQIDLYTAPELKEHAWRAMDAGKTRLLVDLTRVTFMDSTGLGVLVGALKRLRAGLGELAIVVTGSDIERLFELTGLDRTFAVYRTRDEALEHLRLTAKS